MLQRIREGLTLVLIAVLPLHALLVTVGTKLIAGPGNSPLPMLAIWKEALLAVILLIAMVELAMQSNGHRTMSKVDAVDLCIGGLLLIALVQYFVFHLPSSTSHFVYGFKYDFIPLAGFVLLRRVPWSEAFRLQVAGCIVLIGGIVVVYGIATTLFPMSWFTALGYSDLHSLYVSGGPLAPFQQIEASGLRRIQSTLSGPNQLGLWLLIPLSISLIRLQKTFRTPAQWRDLGYLAFLGLVLLKTFSRSAWIAAAVIGAVLAWKYLPKKKFLIATCSMLILGVIAIFAFPNVIVRVASSTGHIERPLQALRIMQEHPLGLGLGTAGPASNRFSDTCVDLPVGADASWAQAHPQLCVFVGGSQVQPIDHACSCPLLPENWYLQIGVELGWIGFVLYTLLIAFILRRLFLQFAICNQDSIANCKLQKTCALALLGISIAALFLHAWEDSAVAYTVWILLAALLIPQQSQLWCFRGRRKVLQADAAMLP